MLDRDQVLFRATLVEATESYRRVRRLVDELDQFEESILEALETTQLLGQYRARIVQAMKKHILQQAGAKQLLDEALLYWSSRQFHGPP